MVVTITSNYQKKNIRSNTLVYLNINIFVIIHLKKIFQHIMIVIIIKNTRKEC